MKTVLVTGGCGFIGSQFIQFLLRQSGWRVVNVDKLTYAGNLENLSGLTEGANYRFVKGDVTEKDLVGGLFQKEQPCAVVNFAAESHVDRSILDSSPFLLTNILGVQVLLDSSRRYGVERFIQISTDEVYGDADGKEQFVEESPLHPSSPYAASKASADLLCQAYQRTYGTPVIICRSSNNYGPFQFPEKLIPLMIRNALMGKALPIYGDGLQQRDWLYVNDNVEALSCILEAGEIGATYNIGTEQERTNLGGVRAICQILSKEAGLDARLLSERMQSVADRPGHDRRYAMTTHRVRDELGWAPRLSLEAGLRRTVLWYLQNRDWVNRVITGEYRNYYRMVYVHAWRDPDDTVSATD